MITEDYVSFETAKLLREKGFNGLCTAYYDCFTTDNFHCGNEPTDFNSIDTKIRNIVAAPTLQMAMKWLRIEKDIAIESTLGTGNKDCWASGVIKDYKTGNRTFMQVFVEFSYEEAYEEAIKYCLENLI